MKQILTVQKGRLRSFKDTLVKEWAFKWGSEQGTPLTVHLEFWTVMCFLFESFQFCLSLSMCCPTSCAPAYDSYVTSCYRMPTPMVHKWCPANTCLSPWFIGDVPLAGTQAHSSQVTPCYDVPKPVVSGRFSMLALSSHRAIPGCELTVLTEASSIGAGHGNGELGTFHLFPFLDPNLCYRNHAPCL